MQLRPRRSVADCPLQEGREVNRKSNDLKWLRVSQSNRKQMHGHIKKNFFLLFSPRISRAGCAHVFISPIDLH